MSFLGQSARLLALLVALAPALAGAQTAPGDVLERCERALAEQAARLDRPDAAPSLADARGYLASVNEFARALQAALLAADESAVAPLRARLEAVLGEGLRRSEAFEPGPATPEEHARWQLERSELFLARATSPPGRSDFLERARASSTELARTHASSSPTGLSARLLLARIERAAGRPREAAAWATSVADAAVPADLALRAWRELAPEQRAERFRLLELAFAELVPALLATGETVPARAAALRFLATWKREGFTLDGAGHVVLLAIARALSGEAFWIAGSLERGDLAGVDDDGRGSEGALALASTLLEEVVRANRGNALEREARLLIAELVERPGAPRSAALLCEAAEGRLARGDPRSAALAFRAAAREPTDDAELARRSALGFHAALARARADLLASGAAADAELDLLLVEAEDLVLSADPRGTLADEIRWQRAAGAHRAGERTRARAGYLELGSSSPRFEEARLQAARCLLPEDPEGARAELTALLERCTDTADVAPDPTRVGACARARFELARLASAAGDSGAVLRWLDGAATLSIDESLTPEAASLVVSAQLAQDDLAGARAGFARLHARFPASPWTGRAALELYRALDAAAQVDGSVAGEGAQSLARERARCLAVVNAGSRDAPFANLVLEASLWLELEDWSSAERALRATLALHGTDPARRAELEGFVLPELGRVLLQTERAAEAFDVLDPLLRASATRPSPTLARHWCRAVTGWIDETDGRSLVHPGVGGAENLARAVGLLEELVRREEGAEALERTCAWYELQVECAWALHQAGRMDPLARALGERRMDDLAALFGEPADAARAERCAGAPLRRFRHLAKELCR